MIGVIAKLFIALNSNTRPGEMASAIAFGFWLALIPSGNLLWILLFLIAFFLKNNTASYLISLALFRLITHFLDPLLDSIGGVVLSIGFLENFFTKLYNLPFLSYTSFNNTVVMGAFLLGLILWLPLYFLFVFIVKNYRKKVAPKIAESKWMKALKKIPFISKIGKAISFEGGL